MSEFDPITTAIVLNRLVATADLAARTLVRTAFSSVVAEMLDFTCLLLDPSCRVVAQATRSQPPFLGTAPWTARHMLSRFPARSLRRGDLLLTNDPWIGTGHLSDFNALMPIFVRESIVGYAVTAAHVPSVGGRVYGADSRDVFEEGLRVPVAKLYRGGRLNRELADLIGQNSRTPVETLGDIEAYRAANLTMARGLTEIAEDLGNDLLPFFDHLRSVTEGVVRTRINAVPDGNYGASLTADGFTEVLRLSVEVTVSGDSMVVRYDAPPQVPRGINCPLTYTRALTLFALKCCLAPDIPNNQGAFEPFTVDAPEGSILHALPPAAVAGRGKVGHHIPNLVMRALEPVLPEAIVADTGNPHASLTFARQSGSRSSESLFFVPGGFGARFRKDGPPCLYFPANCSSPSVEAFEHDVPVLVEEQALAEDSGGPGRTRGGLGQRLRFRNTSSHALVFSPQIERVTTPAGGTQGGLPGGRTVYRTSVDSHPHPKTPIEIGPGEVVELQTAGGGGFGDPRERPLDRILDDLRNGLISEHAADEIYGLADRSLSDAYVTRSAT